MPAPAISAAAVNSAALRTYQLLYQKAKSKTRTDCHCELCGFKSPARRCVPPPPLLEPIIVRNCPTRRTALVLDWKKLAAFSAAAGRFLRFPIGDRRRNRTRASASKRPVTRAQALTNPTLAASRLLHRRSPTASPRARPKKVGAFLAGPFPQHNLPFWMASLVGRLLVLLIPIVA